ncbi:MAG TPA: hypothetical protein O0X32_00515 [Methanocorpusculum sp.]|nr:hypothetical protein [Methanocorpusculum sp.]
MRTDWIDDIIIAITGTFLFGVALLVFQKIPLIPKGVSFILAFAVFIAYLAVMALTVIKKHINIKSVNKTK